MERVTSDKHLKQLIHMEDHELPAKARGNDLRLSGAKLKELEEKAARADISRKARQKAYGDKLKEQGLSRHKTSRSA